MHQPTPPLAQSADQNESCASTVEVPPLAAQAPLEHPVSPPGTATGNLLFKDLGGRVLRNSAALVGGRAGVALLRLVIAGMIVRNYGTGMFAEYSLLFGLLTIADWLVDFGTTDVFVRDICREPQQRLRLLRILTAAKAIQIPAGFACLAALLLALRYPSHIVAAGLVGGTGLVFYAGVLVYRVIFRVNLTMEREVLAELVSVATMVPLVAAVAGSNGGLVALLACHLASRMVYFGGCVLLGKKQFQLSIQSVTRSDLRGALQSSLAIGFVGFLVGGYETLDLLFLSKLSSSLDLAFFSGAQRLVWPLLMVLGSVAGTFYPVCASFWPHDQKRFERICQRSVDTVTTLAGFGICSVWAGAEFFMSLLGRDLVLGAPALRAIALLCFVKAITSTVGPILYVIKAQKKALQFIAIALLVKAAVIAILVPRFGYMGAILGALAVEICFAMMPSLYLVQSLSGFRLQWGVLLKIGLITIAAAAAPQFLNLPPFAATVLAPALYAVLVISSGAVRLAELRSLLRGTA